MFTNNTIDIKKIRTRFQRDLEQRLIKILSNFQKNVEQRLNEIRLRFKI